MLTCFISIKIKAVWGGLRPELLESIVDIPDLCEVAGNVLNTMYSTSLPREVHVADLVKKELPLFHNEQASQLPKIKPVGRAMFVSPCPENEREQFQKHAYCNVCTCGIHSHCLTCRKPPKGYTGCRLNMPRDNVKGTKPVELIDTRGKKC